MRKCFEVKTLVIPEDVPMLSGSLTQLILHKDLRVFIGMIEENIYNTFVRTDSVMLPKEVKGTPLVKIIT